MLRISQVAPMKSVAIVTDSTADLPPERARELDIHVAPLVVHIDGESFEDGTELTPAGFYEKLSLAKGIPSTSQPAVGRFRELFEAIPQKDIVSIHISSGLSGTWNSARLAAEQTPGKRIRVLDSASVSLAVGYPAQTAAQAAAAGADFEQVCSLAEQSIARTGFFAILDTLQFARRSGRLGFAQALIGSMLQVKPIITIAAGSVQPVDRPRTMRKALDRLVELTAKRAPFDELAVLHANNHVLAAELAGRLAAFHGRSIDVVCTGAVIGSHCGPGAVATAFQSQSSVTSLKSN